MKDLIIELGMVFDGAFRANRLSRELSVTTTKSRPIHARVHVVWCTSPGPSVSLAVVNKLIPSYIATRYLPHHASW